MRCARPNKEMLEIEATVERFIPEDLDLVLALHQCSVLLELTQRRGEQTTYC